MRSILCHSYYIIIILLLYYYYISCGFFPLLKVGFNHFWLWAFPTFKSGFSPQREMIFYKSGFSLLLEIMYYSSPSLFKLIHLSLWLRIFYFTQFFYVCLVLFNWILKEPIKLSIILFQVSLLD